MPRSSRPARWAAVLALAAAAGCGPTPTGTVTGTVTVDGKPVANGLITFSSEVGNRDSFNAAVRDGKYATGPIPVGLTKVTVVTRQAAPVETAPPKKEGAAGLGGGLGSGDLTAPPRQTAKAVATVPPKYGSVDTSGLTYEVTRGEQTKDFALTP